MGMDQLLSRYNPWWEGEEYLAGVLDRPVVLSQLKRKLDDPGIIFITGLRRVGKTTVLKLLVRHLIEERGVHPSHILYLSLDDFLLEKRAIADLVDEFRRLHRLPFREHITLLLDEIAHREHYERQLKNIHDSQKVKIIASSSSASVLRSKKPYLTGRSTIVEVAPLDFHEYLSFCGIRIGAADAHLKDAYFDDYLTVGGMPEYVLRRNPEHLQHLVDDVLMKDIVTVHRIRHPHIVKDLFLLLMERAGKIVSVNKVARILGIAPDTARRYLDFLTETYLVHLIPRCGKTNERLLSPRKAYAADLGIRTFFTGVRDRGSLFENAVYLRLRRSDPCYVYISGTEIDFHTANGLLVEAKYGTHDLTAKQKLLFDRIKAKRKYVVRTEHDLGLL